MVSNLVGRIRLVSAYQYAAVAHTGFDGAATTVAHGAAHFVRVAILSIIISLDTGRRQANIGVTAR